MLLIIFESIKLQRIPTSLELLGFMFGTLGILLVIAPTMFTKPCSTCRNRRWVRNKQADQEGFEKSKEKQVRFDSFGISSSNSEGRDEIQA